MEYIDETLAELARARQRFDSVIVAFSGGKDSLAVMDLCLRTFKRTEAFIMEFIPGLSICDTDVAYAESRWHIKVRRYLHFTTTNDLADGVYCDCHWKNNVKRYTAGSVYAQVRKDTGLTLIANGFKRSDGIWRRRVMAAADKSGIGEDNGISPIAGWQKAHVLGYLKLRGIPIPPDERHGARHNGLDLSTQALYWLHDHHPADWPKLLELFPYAQAVIERRRFYPEFRPPQPGAVPDDDDPPQPGEGGTLQPAHDDGGRASQTP